jgi:RNA recognition motif-containing protein
MSSNVKARLYVGHLNYNTTERDLEDLFGEHGKIIDVKVIMDRETRKSKGFAFVEFATAEEADKAREALHGEQFMNFTLEVKQAQEKKR